MFNFVKSLMLLSLSAKKIQLILSLFSLILALLIVGVSLVAANPVISAQTLGKDILPDHVFYPLLMIADRLRLETNTGEKRLQMQVDYGLRRLHHAEQLLEADNLALALTTLTKSQKYMIHAAQEAINTNASPEIKTQLTAILIQYSLDVKDLSSKFNDSQRDVINKLIKECEALIVSLNE
jgi:flagellin-specific chaperone FliS